MEFYFKKTYNQGPLQLTRLSILNHIKRVLFTVSVKSSLKHSEIFRFVSSNQNLARALTSSPETDGGMARVGQ